MYDQRGEEYKSFIMISRCAHLCAKTDVPIPYYKDHTAEQIGLHGKVHQVADEATANPITILFRIVLYTENAQITTDTIVGMELTRRILHRGYDNHL